MSYRKKVTPNFRELMADLKPMTFSEKVDHLWSYYKEWVLIMIIVGLIVSIAITGFINANKEYLFKGMMVNISMSQEGYHYLTEDLFAKLTDGSKDQTLQMDYTNFTSLADPTSGEDNYNASLLFIARVSGQLLDCALLDQLAFEFYLTQEAYGDWGTFFTKEQLDAMGDKVIYAMQENDTVRWPVAIEVSDMPFFQEHAPKNDKIYMVLSGNHPDLNAVQAFWDHLHAWKKAE
ncbi:MAG: hypothetical protein IJB02_01880 [Oscillospiraceae bacterium]|nr:hypothetical protein [Oscillospiraceae bacterium]